MSSKPAIVLVHGFWGGAAHWGNVIVELHKRGYEELYAVENPLTSLADDAARTRQMVQQIDGPVLLVGHSYGGAVITEAGDLPNVVGLVYVAAFAPDAGESPGQLTEQLTEQLPPAAAANLAPDSDGYLWLKQDKFSESSRRTCPKMRPWSWPSLKRRRWHRHSGTPSPRPRGRSSTPGTRYLRRTG